MNQIHKTAIVYPDVEIGNNVYIGAYCVIGGPPEHKQFWDKKFKSVIIKDNVRISNHVTIDSGTTQNTIIQDNCILLAHCHIGHDALIGKNVTISCGVKVGGHAVISDGCNLGLNSVIHQKVVVPEGCMIGASAFVGKKSILEPFRKYAGVPVKDIGSNVRT